MERQMLKLFKKSKLANIAIRVIFSDDSLNIVLIEKGVSS